MVLEVAILDVKSGLESDFVIAFHKASPIIEGMPGYLGHEIQRSIENPSRFILLVRWSRLEDHTVGFRQSAQYKEWKSLLHHFYDPFPEVEHYETITAG
jgi:heme-degrading monooxygenase HmoA